MTRPVGFGMVQRTQEACFHCSGEGEIIAPKDRCENCKGGKVIQEPKSFDVFVEKGMHHGQKISFKEEGDQFPDIIPGDIILVLQLSEHETFAREGDDLLMEKDIFLIESLCGFAVAMKHLDGRTLVIKSKENEIIKPGDVKLIEGEGMPQQRNPMQKGKLLIKFNVVFPESGVLTADMVQSLKGILPPRPKSTEPIPEDAEEYLLATPAVDADQSEDEHSSGEEGGGGRGEPGIACHPQ